MTLIVSLRIPDGIVLAGDSLSTLMSGTELQGDIDVTCPQCGHEHVATAKLQAPALPATTLAYAQKIFPFIGEFGVGTSGAGQLLGKTIYFAMRELEKEVMAKDKKDWPTKVSEVADLIGGRAHEILIKQTTAMALDIGILPDDWEPVSFQVVGYEDDVATSILIGVGKGVNKETFNGPGCTVMGQKHVVGALWGLTPNPEDKPIYNAFSLQDAITYAEFLISATASHQQFLRTIPTVGGAIDVALITPFDHFKWIRQKPLFAKISEKTNEPVEQVKQQESTAATG